MTAPRDPQGPPETPEEDHEIVLRLGDILERVPQHLHKPGQHDPSIEVRFAVDELAEKMARGRVAVPFKRLADACPGVFKPGEDFPTEPEIALPLQKLLARVGLVARKGEAREPAERPRAEATPARQPAPAQGGGFGRAFSQLFGFGGRQEPPADKARPAARPQPREEKAAQPKAGGGGRCISLGALPIFRLLPGDILRPGEMPGPEARVELPLELIEPQLAAGHVELPLEQFRAAMPEELRGMLNEVPGARIWIPLGEIFQNLPPDHLYYMPLEELAVPGAAKAAAPAEAAAAEEAPAASEPQGGQEPVEVNNAEPEPEPQPEAQVEPERVPEPAAEAGRELEPKAEAQPEPEAQAEPVPQPEPELEAPPAPWMRGFRTPPPVLFPARGTAAAAEEAESPVAPEPPQAPAPTPEAKRTVDFLAAQPGIFAAAAFMERAAFASTDFPRVPDLDALRELMGGFAEQVRRSVQRLGWSGVATFGCGGHYATAVVRARHFIVALHHDRVLPQLAQDALTAAAEELGKMAQ